MHIFYVNFRCGRGWCIAQKTIAGQAPRRTVASARIRSLPLISSGRGHSRPCATCPVGSTTETSQRKWNFREGKSSAVCRVGAKSSLAGWSGCRVTRCAFARALSREGLQSR